MFACTNMVTRGRTGTALAVASYKQLTRLAVAGVHLRLQPQADVGMPCHKLSHPQLPSVGARNR